ncbi:NFX1-type zinc finger-containing protein 1 [Genypterus blacodes]|uniref:NFX1-type zinc finger-containing protein 1 n=1 Tax=Genypterus blacodes TaxID=154954 RepID=UPI003F75CE0E
MESKGRRGSSHGDGGTRRRTESSGRTQSNGRGQGANEDTDVGGDGTVRRKHRGPRGTGDGAEGSIGAGRGGHRGRGAMVMAGAWEGGAGRGGAGRGGAGRGGAGRGGAGRGGAGRGGVWRSGAGRVGGGQGGGGQGEGGRGGGGPGRGGAGRGGVGRGGDGRGGGGRGRGGGGGAKMFNMVEQRGAYSVDRRGGGGRDERRNGNRKEQERNGQRSHSADRGGRSQGRRLGYRTLEELSGKDPSEVMITLASHPALREALDERDMRKDLVELFCRLLGKAFQRRTDRGSLQHLAGIVKDSAFLQTTLPHYLGGMASEFNADRREHYPQHLDNILSLASEVLSNYPSSSVPVVSVLLTLFQASINSLRALGVDIPAELVEKLEHLQRLINHFQERAREGTLRSKDHYALLTGAGGNEDEEEPEDFRTIPIYPTRDEFHQEEKPFLRANLTTQRYINTHVYLDTHFRLLREDFVRPLREGIQRILYIQMNIGGGDDNVLKKERFDDIRVYFDTRLIMPKCTTSGLAYVVKFDTKPLQFVRWQNSKRLIFGSLVCLSCDYFEDFLFASVSDRDPKALEKGLVQLTFTEESRVKLAMMKKDQAFLMVETTAYFEAYRYVLEGLQEQEEDNLPFQRYIVECSPDVHPPAYLRRIDTYNLSAVADPRHVRPIKPFHSLQPDAWPSMEELGLDESQMRALQLALTKELAIIQGPPGTGKTYVGLKIAQAILTNWAQWCLDDDTSPMLVVCYTNHALDQFLEGILKFLKGGIVRVGGRSNSEILKDYNLRALSQSPQFKRKLPSHLNYAVREIYTQMHQEEADIQSHSVKMECSMKGVMNGAFLHKFISEVHWKSLNSPPMQYLFDVYDGGRRNLMLEWLACTVALQGETENANESEEEYMDVDQGHLIEIAEEADLIQADRMIDDDMGDGDGDLGRALNDHMKVDIQDLEAEMLAMNLEEVEIQADQADQGFQIQKKQQKKMKKKTKKRLKAELKDSSVMTEVEEAYFLDVWNLSLQERWNLYRLWVSRYRAELLTKTVAAEQAYQNTVDRLADVRRQESLCILNQCKVIGMTTTGAAKFRKVLQEVRPRVVIVEEAAEVLEAHTITTLSQACEHLILIGDHQQLRPSATVYELAKNHCLEVSMFERLVKMEIPYVRLNYQHRMRPEIARLLTPHIYSELENHPSVMNFENIKGLNTNLFFVEHQQLEEGIADGKSHRNKHEAAFVVALCSYLILQEYKPEQITILTTYTGQLLCLRNLMPASKFAGVKVHVVDKYQGEENDIVLLSLVRCNKQGKVGFLSIPNRVCVALSRAKKGLYCIGSRAMLSKVKLWSDIFDTLSENGQVGKALTLCCQNHPTRQVKASCAEDFKQAPEGGCLEPCDFRLACGHVCASVCHAYDVKHIVYRCQKKCETILCDLKHKCPLVCYETCPELCPVKVEKIIPSCQHKQMVPCHQDPGTFACLEPCKKRLECGHPCKSTCGAPCTTMCKVKVVFRLECGHSQEDECYYKNMEFDPKCRTSCSVQLQCGHGCPGSCARCFQGRFHSPCSQHCDRLLVCSHKCKEPCTRDCPPCCMPCQNFCVHSKCKNTCGQRCSPCAEPCAWQCPHLSCSKLCHEPCDRPPCTEPCEETLKCGHPCIGLCGDKCPRQCRICDRDDVTEIFFGTEDDPEAHFIQLEDCGHIFESTSMDQWMGENEQANEENVAIKLKECPRCRTPIRKNLRYGTHINRSLAEIEMVKRKINRQEDVEQLRLALIKQWQENLGRQMYAGLEYRSLLDRVKEPHLTVNDLLFLEHKMDFRIKVKNLLKFEKTNMSDLQAIRFRKDVDTFVEWLNSRNQKFSEQQLLDLQKELLRLNLLAELNARDHLADIKGKTAEVQFEVHNTRIVLEKPGPLTDQDVTVVKKALKKLDEKLPGKGLQISDEERKMILSAFKLPPGHWYKCPNGHVYLITECGGATESRTCPDCKATIGGANHTLVSTNQVATEMDGAQHGAWSDANNLLNYGAFNEFGL